MGVTVIDVKPGTAEAERFLDLPDRVRRDDPRHIMEPHAAVARRLWGSHAAAEQRVLLAVEDGSACVRCVARPDSVVPGIGTIGLFEAVEHSSAVATVLGTAETYLRECGCRFVLGPMDGDTWHYYRFTVGPYDRPPFLKEPWNPPYYAGQWEACGYEVSDTYLSSLIHTPSVAADALRPFVKRVECRGFTFRPLRLSHLGEELDKLYTLSLATFAENAHYTPISRDSFLGLYDGVKPLLREELCQFCCRPDGTEIGFVFCFPDMADAVRAMRGRSGLAAKARFLLHRGCASRVCIKTLGCLPEVRGKGIGPALMGIAFEKIVMLGYSEALMCLMHETNDSTRLDGGSSVPYRQYVLFRKELG